MSSARYLAGPIASAAIAVLLASGALGAQTPGQSPWSYDHDMRLTYEYDDNINEGVVDPVHAALPLASVELDCVAVNHADAASWRAGLGRTALGGCGDYQETDQT